MIWKPILLSKDVRCAHALLPVTIRMCTKRKKYKSSFESFHICFTFSSQDYYFSNWNPNLIQCLGLSRLYYPPFGDCQIL